VTSLREEFEQIMPLATGSQKTCSKALDDEADMGMGACLT
jgi:hypothetical protein